MIMVFFIIGIIVVILNSLKHISNHNISEGSVEKTQINVPSTAESEEFMSEEDRIVVALAASIAASEGKESPHFQIKKITRIK